NLHNALQLKQLYQLKNLGYNYTDVKPFSYESQKQLELPHNLTELKLQAQNCHLCSLSKSRSNVVFGEGNANADIMFIGDAPIEIEDNQGKVFLGRSGEMLTLMIEKVLGLSRQDVYITNLLKCHPLATQTLHESAMHSCKAYLFKEIELIKPKVIVTLGEMSYHYLTNDTTPLKEIRGNLSYRGDYTIVPTYHPNFLLKNPSFKKEVFVDLKKVKGLI
nr:uracil-DNA glycosylase [Campylobacterota bacterium]